MAQDYKLTFFKAGDFQDNFGNTWCEAAFEGVSEPVRWVVKDPTKVHVGDMVYGHIEDATSKAGKPYLRFKTDKRDDVKQTSFAPGEKKEWQPRDDQAIRAQWAIGQAMNAAVSLSTDGTFAWEDVEKTAKEVFKMVERVKVANQEVSEDMQRHLDEIAEVTDEPINLDNIPF